jgi:hypothetical protein
MKRFITDLIDDLKCISFTSKAWNYIGLVLVILAGWYWGSLSDNGDFFKVTGCILYGVATYNWISKSELGKFMLDLLK